MQNKLDRDDNVNLPCMGPILLPAYVLSSLMCFSELGFGYQLKCIRSCFADNATIYDMQESYHWSNIIGHLIFHTNH